MGHVAAETLIESSHDKGHKGPQIIPFGYRSLP